MNKAVLSSDLNLIFVADISELRKKVFAYKNKNIKICSLLKIDLDQNDILNIKLLDGKNFNFKNQ